MLENAADARAGATCALENTAQACSGTWCLKTLLQCAQESLWGFKNRASVLWSHLGAEEAPEWKLDKTENARANLGGLENPEQNSKMTRTLLAQENSEKTVRAFEITLQENLLGFGHALHTSLWSTSLQEWIFSGSH